MDTTKVSSTLEKFPDMERKQQLGWKLNIGSMWLKNHDGSVCEKSGKAPVDYSEWPWVSECPEVCAVVPVGISVDTKHDLKRYRLAQDWENIRLCLLHAAENDVDKWTCLRCNRAGTVRDAVHTAGCVLLYGR